MKYFIISLLKNNIIKSKILIFKICLFIFYEIYHFYFNLYGTKYKLIKKFDSYLHAPPNIVQFKIHYTEKNIWVDFKINDKWYFRYLLQDIHKEFYCDIQRIGNFVGCRFLSFIEAKDFKIFRKRKCERCEEFTYCAKYEYTANINSYFYTLLKNINNPSRIEFMWNGSILKQFIHNICGNYKDYLDLQSIIASKNGI